MAIALRPLHMVKILLHLVDDGLLRHSRVSGVYARLELVDLPLRGDALPIDLALRGDALGRDARLFALGALVRRPVAGPHPPDDQRDGDIAHARFSELPKQRQERA